MNTNKINVLLSLFLLIISGCSKSPTSSNNLDNTSWVFVANEGKFCSEQFEMDCSNNEWGSISMIDDFGNLKTVNNVGNTVQSITIAPFRFKITYLKKEIN